MGSPGGRRFADLWTSRLKGTARALPRQPAAAGPVRAGPASPGRELSEPVGSTRRPRLVARRRHVPGNPMAGSREPPPGRAFSSGSERLPRRAVPADVADRLDVKSDDLGCLLGRQHGTSPRGFEVPAPALLVRNRVGRASGPGGAGMPGDLALDGGEAGEHRSDLAGERAGPRDPRQIDVARRSDRGSDGRSETPETRTRAGRDLHRREHPASRTCSSGHRLIPANARNSRPVMGTKRTRSPGSRRAGGACRPEEAAARAADDSPSSGSLEGVDAGLAAADRNAAGRHLPARNREPGRGDPRGQPAQVGKPGAKPRNATA